jgi:protein O-GlcNAc transferase
VLRRILGNLFPSGADRTLQEIIAAATRLEAAGEAEEAERTYEQGLERHSGAAPLHVNLGTLYKRQGRLADAVTQYRHAVELDPTLTAAWYNLGLALYDSWQLDEAAAAFWQALARAQDAQAAGYLSSLCASHALTLQALRKPAQARAFLLEAGQRFPEIEEECARCALFTLSLIEETEPAAALDDRAWAARHADPSTPPEPAPPIRHGRERPLRVGYLSGDFRAHPTASFISPILRHHDRSAFEIWCYDNSPASDAMSAWLKKSRANWRDIRGLGDEAAVQRIRDDGIDILVDLAGHTAYNRIKVVARKPAPLQVGYLGYLATSGMRAMDYRLTDAVADPPADAQPFHSEVLLHLPHTQWCWEPPQIAPPVAAQPFERYGHVRFGSFTQFAKLTDSMLDNWAQILLAVPESRLVMVGVPAGAASEAVLARLLVPGVTERRIVIAGRLNYREYLATVSEADIALDTFPYNGATTTCEALWMGVPVISLAGRLGASRSGASILRATGLGELVADSAASYVRLAAQLASDRQRLARLRNGMRSRMSASPLMDGPRFTAELEKLYRLAWERHCGK